MDKIINAVNIAQAQHDLLRKVPLAMLQFRAQWKALNELMHSIIKLSQLNYCCCILFTGNT